MTRLRDALVRRDRRGVAGRPAGGDDSARQNMVLLVQLRWLAVAGQIITIAVAHLGLGIVLPLGPMTAILASLVALNLATSLWLRPLDSTP